MSATYSLSTLKIDLKAISQNYAILQNQAGGKEVAAVVKANAYGVGVEQVAPVLKDAGCSKFFVATLDEAVGLRKILPDVLIGVFGGVVAGQEGVFYSHEIIPVLNCKHQIKTWVEHAEKRAEKLNSILHIDSGMNRLGISIEEAEELKGRDLLGMLDLQMIISHLACADMQTHVKNPEQLLVAKKIKKLFPDIPLSLSNSYGTFLSSDFHFDIIRPGIALYGGNPLPGKENPMKQVVSLTSKILQIRQIDTPQTVGYGATCNLPEGSVIATVPVGYADGYLRSLSNKAHCAVGGKKVPLVGRVSMDLITIDITSIKDDVNVGDEVEIIGSTIKLEDLATDAGTIDYEILTSLGSRYRRIYTK